MSPTDSFRSPSECNEVRGAILGSPRDFENMQNKSDRTSFGSQEVRVGLLKFSKSPKKSPKSPTTFSDFEGLRRIPTDSNRTSDGVRRVRSESVGPFLDIFEEKSPADSDGSPMKSKKRPSESDGLNWTRFGHPTESVGLLFTSDTCPMCRHNCVWLRF